MLTQRYLRLLTTVDEPEQVLAITFTRKAAGEMRERVQKALEGDIEVRSPADALTLELAAAVRAHAAQRGWGLEDSAARLRIQTIDAFNGYLANSLPITSQQRIRPRHRRRARRPVRARRARDPAARRKRSGTAPAISSSSCAASTTAGCGSSG